MQTINEQNPLATKPIGKLIATYAIPSIIAMLVNSLYNIVDQVFIGHGVGYLGNAATTIAFPVITIGLAIALIFGNGCAAYISLKLGQKDSKLANNALGSTFILVLIISIIFSIVAFIFINPLLNILGATENIWQYSYSYITIILVGQPFVILSTALSSIIRADGSPKYSMVCMLVGALLNTILDPIFIFAFKMGVAGAALATVISQIVSFLVAILYFNRRAKNVVLKPMYLKPHAKVIKAITTLGFSSFVTQMAITLVNIVLNNLLRHHGALSPFGSDIPLSAMGIVMKVNGILISVLIGIAIGAQPILGYNYGAKNFNRVKQTYKLSVLIATIVGICSWALFQLFPEGIILAFGDNSPEFVQFSAAAFRIFLGGIFLAGFQIVSAQYFQATGRPGKAALLSMSRQIILLIPLMLLLSYLMGLMGVLYAGIVADISAATITAIFIILEMQKLNRKIALQEQPA